MVELNDYNKRRPVGVYVSEGSPLSFCNGCGSDREGCWCGVKAEARWIIAFGVKGCAGFHSASGTAPSASFDHGHRSVWKAHGDAGPDSRRACNKRRVEAQGQSMLIPSFDHRRKALDSFFFFVLFSLCLSLPSNVYTSCWKHTGDQGG